MEFEKIYTDLTGGCNEVPEGWVSVTSLRNIQQNDSILLWAKYWAEKLYGIPPDPEIYSMLSFFSKMGSAFEARFTQELMPEAVQVIEHDHECRQAASLRKSLEALQSSALVLTKVALWGGPDVRMYGTADIVARAGFLRSKFPGLLLDDPDNTWIICDCKFSARLLESDHRVQYEINATQVRAYTFMLNRMLGEEPMQTKAFLFTKDSPYQPVTVHVTHKQDGSLDPEIAALRDRAIDIKINGWRYKPWCGDPQVTINYSNSQSEPWGGLKSCIMQIMQPLEMLPGIGKARADALRAAGHVNLTTMLESDIGSLELQSIKGIGPTMEAKIKAALYANKTGKPSTIPSHAVPPPVDVSVFLDFEFFPGIHCPLDDPTIPFPECLVGTPMIFLAGVGTEDRDGKFKFRRFLAQREDHRSEKSLLLDMLNYLDELGVFDLKKTSAIYVFSGAERSRCAEAVRRHGPELERLNRLPLVDLQAVFSKNHLYLPGTYGHGLKEISRAINVLSPDHAVAYPSELSQAATAMCMGWAYYEQPTSKEANDLLSSMTAYLKCDCKAMWQILRWMRANATNKPALSSTTLEQHKREAFSKSGGTIQGWYPPQREKSNIHPISKGWYIMARDSLNT